MSMKIKTKKYNEIPVLQIEGDAIGKEAANISKKLEPYMKTSEPVIAIDLSNTDSIDSYGLGVFVFSWKQLSTQNRKLVFVNPQGFIKNLFSGTNLTKVFTIVESLEAL